jgi:proteic killer suppression protein
MFRTEIEISKKAKKEIVKLPKEVVKKLRFWIKEVSLIGLREVRKIKSFHDEPLQGDRQGQRSIRLNKAYRAFYIVNKNREIELVEIIEINKHKY